MSKNQMQPQRAFVISTSTNTSKLNHRIQYVVYDDGDVLTLARSLSRLHPKKALETEIFRWVQQFR